MVSISLGALKSVQTRSIQWHCKRQGSEKSTLLVAIFWGIFDFYQDRLLSRNSTRKPLNLIEPPFLQTPLVNPLVFTMRLVCLGGRFGYFLFFSCSWAGEREEAREVAGGGAGSNKNRGRGGLSEEEAREREGRRESVCGEGGGG